MNERSDLDLLQEFARARSDAAFAGLTQRYVNLVYSVALRMCGNRQAAEDASQGVFAALALQAGEVMRKVAKGMPLSAWLHATTRNVAAKTVRGEARRRAREQTAADMEMPALNDESAAWDEIAPHLDDALQELCATDRHALLLRYYEQKTAGQIGRELKLSEEAAQKRVVRALDRLRRRLTARGVPISASALALVLAGNAVQAAPASLAATAAAAALAAGLAAPAGFALSTFNLASALAMTKTQTAALALLASAIAVPLTLQRASLAELRQELRSAQMADPETARLNTGAPPNRARESAPEELARLNRQAQELRRTLAEVRVAKQTPRPPAGPTLLQPGRAVALSELVHAGNETPAAALQSMLAACRDGDADVFFQLMLQRPDRDERRALETEEGRERAAEMLRSQVGDLAAVEVLGTRPITDRRVQLVVREVRTNAVTTNVMSFGQGARGWIQIL